jgi:hypothetical protein
MTAFLPEDYNFYIVKMSNEIRAISVDLKNRKSAILEMQQWTCNHGYTPASSVMTAIEKLCTLAGNDENWLVVFTDGNFQGLSQTVESNMATAISNCNFKTILLNIGIRANLASLFSQLGVTDIFYSTTNATEVIGKMGTITTTLLTLPEHGLMPQHISGRDATINSIFPLKRLIVLDQLIGGNPNTIEKANAGALSLQSGKSFFAQKDNISSRITHIESDVANTIIPAGEINIRFKENLTSQNLTFLPQVALDLQVDVVGYFKSKVLNRIVVCHNDNEVEVRARIVTLDGNSLSPEIHKMATVQLLIGQQKVTMSFADSIFKHTLKVDRPITLSVTAMHQGYFHFRSNLYTLSVEKCPVITIPKETEIEPFKVTESELAKVTSIRPLVDGVSVPLSQTSQLQLNAVQNDFFDIVATNEAWELRIRQTECPCFAKTGIFSIPVELRSLSSGKVIDTGFVTVHVINEPFYVKCLRFILWILLILLLLWYIIGIIKKPRFSRKYNLFYRYDYGKNKNRINPYRFRSNFIKRYLVPYSPETASVEGIQFKASGRNNFVNVSKKSLNSIRKDDLIYFDGMEQTAGKFSRDLRMGTNVPLEIKASNSKHTYRYIKTSDNNNYY